MTQAAARLAAPRVPPSLGLSVARGFAPAIDDAAALAAPEHGFLRAAWFASAGGATPETLVARRSDGALLAAIPTVMADRRVRGLRAIPGSYWPFRAFPADSAADAQDFAALLAERTARRALGPVWRMGPIYACDPLARHVAEGAARAGWQVLTRNLGHTYVLDLKALLAAGRWPRKSTLSRTRNYERQLAAEAPLRWHVASGAGWSDAILADLAAIERNSWVGRSTDGSGAKFLRPEQRSRWASALRDPVLAERLSALILYVGDKPAAFSFDLRSGPLLYGIASSYDEAFARFRPGKIVTWRGIADAIAGGVERIDWGAGDSGYKREAGAKQAGDIVDLLFVQSRPLAALLRKRWEIPPPNDEAKDVPTIDGFGIIEHALMGGLIASAAVAMME